MQLTIFLESKAFFSSVFLKGLVTAIHSLDCDLQESVPLGRGSLMGGEH